MLQSIVLIVHVAVSLLIIGLVLLQRGKGADAGAGFGAGASGTVFGSRGSASFLSRATGALATAFFVTSLLLAFYSNQVTAPESLLERTSTQQQTQQTPQAVPTDDSGLPSIDEPRDRPVGDNELPTLGGGDTVPATEGGPTRATNSGTGAAETPEEGNN